jgi:hypothetical protein
MRLFKTSQEVAMRKIVFSLIVSMLMLSGSAAFAREPVENVNPYRQPNIAEAQRLCRMAYENVVAAQKANEYDMGGHAQKAKELLEKANWELKQAAQVANRNRGR